MSEGYDALVNTLYYHLCTLIKKYHISDDIEIVDKAYNLANKAHKKQKRKSGEPFITHPLSVAINLAELKMDKETIAAALLHDVVEDTEISLENIKTLFGEEISILVDGVTKLNNIGMDCSKDILKIRTYQKMFIAMSYDIRVLIIKLADRLHNIRTLKYQKKEKQISIGLETLEIYSPLAKRMGINIWADELINTAFQYTYPEKYTQIKNILKKMKSEKGKLEYSFIEYISGVLDNGRNKCHIYIKEYNCNDLQKNMEEKSKLQIGDIERIIFIVPYLRDCYIVLGILHTEFKPIPGNFYDYIATDHVEFSKGLYTKVLYNKEIFSIEIRTQKQNEENLYGITLDWKYKENSQSEKMLWLRQILSWQKKANDEEFDSLLKNELNINLNKIECFTPKGDAVLLPNGACVIDFAFAIHSEIGYKIVGAKVNQKNVSINYILQEGDIVKILTSDNSEGPNEKWLRYVKTSIAISKIKQWIKKMNKNEKVYATQESLNFYCYKNHIELKKIKSLLLQTIPQKWTWEKFLLEYQDCNSYARSIWDKAVRILGKDNSLLIRNNSIINWKQNKDIVYARCCMPIYGDDLVGVISSKKISIHCSDCENILKREENIVSVRVIESNILYSTGILVKSNKGLCVLNGIVKVFFEKGKDIKFISNNENDRNNIKLLFMVKNKRELQDIMDNISTIEGVIKVERIKNNKYMIC